MGCLRGGTASFMICMFDSRRRYVPLAPPHLSSSPWKEANHDLSEDSRRQPDVHQPSGHVLLAVLLGSCHLAGAAETTSVSATKPVFLIVPHTHWEGAVFKTREEYLQQGLPHILKALKLLKTFPDYHFVLDQACYVRPFLERYPEEAAAFRKFVKQGRLQVIGGTDCMPDVNMPSGESFIRQILYGKGYFRRKLDIEVTSLWDIDTFGHHAQIPQILKLAGYKACWLSRGIPDGNVPSEFFWEGIDGTRLATYRLPVGYGLVFGRLVSLPEFDKFIKPRYDVLTPSRRGPTESAWTGGDVTTPEEHVPRMVEAYNRQPDAPLRLQLAVPADYEALMEQQRRTPGRCSRGNSTRCSRAPIAADRAEAADAGEPSAS